MLGSRLVLASTSAHRKALLSRLGLRFEAHAPAFEEVGAEHLSPAEIALSYARGKALAVAGALAGQDVLVIGCDQVCELDGEILHKCLTEAEAQDQLERLQGRTHALHDGLFLYRTSTSESREALVTTRMTMRALDADQIAAYVDRDRPLYTCGGYTFEGTGVALFENIVGGDDSAIVGLPLMSLTRLLTDFGVDPLRDGPRRRWPA